MRLAPAALIQSHSDANHPAYDVDAIPIVDFRIGPGRRVGQQQKLIAIQAAPPAGIPVAMLQKVDGAIKFVFPA
jgi:hypothetical protein